MAYLSQLKGCQVQLTHVLAPGNRIGLRKLGLNTTCEPLIEGENILGLVSGPGVWLLVFFNLKKFYKFCLGESLFLSFTEISLVKIFIN